MPSPKDTHGPIVKTGPTAGQNRSRNNDGAWRAKRSDAGSKRSNNSNESNGQGLLETLLSSFFSND